MQRVAVILIALIVGAFLLNFLPASTAELISPLAKKEQQTFAQKLIDDKVFEESKHRVAAEPVDWARGKGSSHALIIAPYVVVNKDGEVVYSLYADTRRSPASLAKLMTAMVVLDTSSLDDKFTVPREAVDMEPTTLMVREGERFPLQDLLEAALITSANDAAHILGHGVAEKLGGSPEVFVRLMNEKAKNLGLENTHFANPTGYDDPEQYSTPRELAKMAKHALDNYPLIREIVEIHEATIEETEEHGYYELPNWNALLGVYPGVDGVKIGYTGDAGYVTIVTSEREGARFMVVLLGTPDKRARDLWTAELLNSAFSESGVKPYRVTLNMLQKRSAEWGEQLRKAAESAER